MEEIIIDEAALKPCTGCLTCYLSNGGTCVHSDGYRPLREVARRMDCVVLFTEITFGQASVAIKQAIDKGIGVPWGLCGPFPAQLIVGYGGDLVEDEASCFLDVVRRHLGKAEELHLPFKECVVDARIVLEPGDIDPTLEVLEGFVESVPAGAILDQRGSGALSLQGSTTRGKGVDGNPSLPASALRHIDRGGHGRAQEPPLPVLEPCPHRTVCLLNGSLRGQASTSHFLLNALEARLGESSVPMQREALSMGTLTTGLGELADRILGCDVLVVALPVFCYSVPAGLLRLLVELRRRSVPGRAPEFFAIVYSGSVLPHISAETVRVLRVFAAKSGWRWGGSLVVGGGLLFKKMERFPILLRRLDRPLSAMASAVRGDPGAQREDFCVRPPIPRFVADLIRNSLDRSAVRKAAREKRVSNQVPSKS